MRIRTMILTTFASLGAVLLVPMSASAALFTTVGGEIRDGSNTLVQGASVSVKCNSTTLTDTSDSFGVYGVAFTDAQCPANSQAFVTASKGSLIGKSNGPVTGHSTINISIQDVKITSVPELSAFTAGGAALIGGGAFMVVRRRSTAEEDSQL